VIVPCHVNTEPPGCADTQGGDTPQASLLIIAMPTHMIRTVVITIEQQKVKALFSLNFYATF
jgi:hypothetical protein